MSDSDETDKSVTSDSETGSDSSYDSCHEESQANAGSRTVLPQLRLNTEEEVPPTPRVSSIPFNRLQLGGLQPSIPRLGLAGVPSTSSESPKLFSARPAGGRGKRAPLQGTENTLAQAQQKPPTVKLPPMQLDVPATQQISQPGDPIAAVNKAGTTHLDLLAQGLQISAAQLTTVAKKNSTPLTQVLRQEVADSFGVEPAQVKLFQLQELADTDASSCSRLAIEIPGAGFSVEAMEEIMEVCNQLRDENSQLRLSADQSIQALAALQQQTQQQTELLAEGSRKEHQNLESCSVLGKENQRLEAETKDLRKRLETAGRESPLAERGSETSSYGFRHWTSIFGEGKKDQKDAAIQRLEAEKLALKGELQELRGKLARSWMVMEEARTVVGELRREVDLLSSRADSIDCTDLQEESRNSPPGDDAKLAEIQLQGNFVECLSRLCKRENVATLEKMVELLSQPVGDTSKRRAQ